MSKRIIYLDDDLGFLSLLEKVTLEKFPSCKVELYSCPLKFMTREEAACSLVVLDLSLGAEFTGIHVAKEFRKTDKETPLVVMSGFSTEYVRPSFEGIDINDFWDKGFDLLNLKDKLKPYLL